MAGEFLPPIVTRLTGDIDDLVKKIEEAKAAMKSLKDVGDIPIKFDVDTRSLARARTYARQLQDALPNDTVKINFDVNQASLARSIAGANAMSAATTRTTRTGRRWTQWLAVAHNILTIFGANIIADTIGIIAFGIGATAAFAPVVEAVGNLGKTYAYLNPYQKVATTQITNFIHQFQNANQSGIFSVFTQLLSMVNGKIGSSGGIMHQATIAFEDFAAMLKSTFASGPWQQMFGRDSTAIRTDMDALFRLINALINVIPALFHDFNGLGLAFINSATFLLHLIAVVGDANPSLMRFAAMVFLVYRALKMMGQLQAGSLLSKALAPALNAVSFSMKDLGAAAALARTEGIVPAASALTGLEGGALLAGGAVGVLTGAIFITYMATRNWDTATGHMITRIQQLDAANSNNVHVWQQGLNTMQQAQTQLTKTDQATTRLNQTQGVASRFTQGYSADLDRLNGAIAQQRQGFNNVNSALIYLMGTYHLSEIQAEQLAKATGVDLSKGLTGSSDAARLARSKIQAYEQTVKAAQNPTTVLGYDMGLAANQTLHLDDRVTALTNAFNALLTPFANVIADTVTWRQGNSALAKAVRKSSGEVGYNTAKQQASASALATSITNTTNLSSAILTQTGSMQKAIAPVQREISVLEALHSKSQIVAQAIRILEQYINSLHSKTITLRANYIDNITRNYYTHGQAGHATGYATGTSYATPGLHMVGERGPELMYFRGGERVAPNHRVNSELASVAASGGGGAVPQINVYVDGKKLFQVMQERTFGYNVRTNNRTPRGSAVGKVSPR